MAKRNPFPRRPTSLSRDSIVLARLLLHERSTDPVTLAPDFVVNPQLLDDVCDRYNALTALPGAPPLPWSLERIANLLSVDEERLRKALRDG